MPLRARTVPVSAHLVGEADWRRFGYGSHTGYYSGNRVSIRAGKFGPAIFLHELFHHCWAVALNGTMRADWERQIRAHPGWRVSNYGAAETSPVEEWFCEAGVSYLINPPPRGYKRLSPGCRALLAGFFT